MWYYLLQLLFLLGFPLLVLHLEKSARIIRWISPIIVCYLIGIGVGNIPWFSLNKGMLIATCGLSVLIAIPLLLFSAHFFTMLKLVRPALFAFALGILGVLLTAFLAALVFRGRIPQPETVSGMLIGVYSGGTPNMSAIGIALGVKEEVFVLLNSADIIFSGTYFIFLLTGGKYVLGLILPAYKSKGASFQVKTQGNPEATGKGHSWDIPAGVGFSLLILGVVGGITWLIMPNWDMDRAFPVIILGITTLGIGASLLPGVRRLNRTYSTANYLLLVFAIAMGSQARFSELLATGSTLFLYCGMVVIGSVLVHIILSVIFRIDRDTMIIASTAAIFGPAFIGPVAETIGNRELVGIGIALGLIGIAIGNYLGLGFAMIMH